MFEVLRFMLLLLTCLTATARVEMEEKSTSCVGGGGALQNITDLKRDCHAALSLVPNTGIEADPHNMAMKGMAPHFILRLTGKKTYRINGDKIRLPALFMSGDCLITVSGDVKDEPGNQALFSHIYFWPQVRKQVQNIIDMCFQPPTSRGNNVVYWSMIGYSDSRFHTEDEFPAELYTELHVRPMRSNAVLMGNLSTPLFTERDVLKFRDYNVYTPTGLINDARWETPFERPTAPVTVVHAGTRCLIGSRRLLNKEFLEKECNAALSLVPKSKRDIDLRRNGTDPGSGKLIEKEYQVNGDKIRLPAVFISEYCLVQVFWLHEHIGHKRRREVPFNNIYVWPTIYKQVRKIIKACLGVPVVDRKNFYWSPIGAFQTKIYMEDEFPAEIMTYVNVRPFKPTDPGNSNNPHFTEVELYEYRDFNVYTPTGQIHDPRWKEPFQRPSS